jgi:two-component system response regulator AtoC
MGVSKLELLGKRHRVLLLEHDPEARQAILAQLKKADYAVVEAAGSNEAATLLGMNGRSAAVSVILCDIRASKINGVEAPAYFRARHPRVPVIVTAAYPDIEWAIELMKRGVTDYLVKPVSHDDLMMVIKNAVDRYMMVKRWSL